jgi:pimeloyl-ACP methyl ester carboxylesterase
MGNYDKSLFALFMGSGFSLLFLAAYFKSSSCPDGITCKTVQANGLTFDCHLAGQQGKAGDVMLLHGFPEWSSMYVPLMLILAEKGYSSVACDQRGYSKGASPDKEEDYNYNLLRDDIFAVAEAVGFDKFHLVAHDHGAVLGWYAAGSDRGKERFLSYSALSIPHTDAFSAGLYGPSADLDQQVASQYFTIFTLKDSASLHGYMLYLTMGLTSGFYSASDFQKALWWYNGAFDVGVISMPPLFNSSFLSEHGSTSMSTLRWMFGGTPNDGVPQKVTTGSITTPSLFVCGTSDTAILCNKPYALKTAEYCAASGSYQHVTVDCGHHVLGCSSQSETQKVLDAIVNRIVSASSNRVHQVVLPEKLKQEHTLIA